MPRTCHMARNTERTYGHSRFASNVRPAPEPAQVTPQIADRPLELVVEGVDRQQRAARSGMIPAVERELGAKPTVRDYGCGLVAVLAGLMFVAAVLGGTLALVASGPSFGLIVGVGFQVLFWFWIALGAWRRTTWSSTHTSATGTEGA